MAEPPNSHIAFVPAIAPVIEAGEALVVGLIAILYGDDNSGVIATQTSPLAERTRIERQVTLDLQDDDSTRVLKVSDAIKCIEDFINKPENLGTFLAAAIVALVKRAHTGYAAIAKDALAGPIVACLRAKALPQVGARAKATIYSRKAA